jgi:hypothetical protein
VRVTGGWRKLCNEELHDLCSSSNDTWMTKSRRVMQGAGHVTHVGKYCDWETEGKYRLEGTYKGVPVQAVKAYRGSRVIAPVIHKFCTRRR